MGFARDPRIRHVDPCPAKVIELIALGRERPVGVVHHHLRDGDRIGPVVHHGQVDAVGREGRPFDLEALHRRHPSGRSAPPARAGRSR